MWEVPRCKRRPHAKLHLEPGELARRQVLRGGRPQVGASHRCQVLPHHLWWRHVRHPKAITHVLRLRAPAGGTLHPPLHFRHPPGAWGGDIPLLPARPQVPNPRWEGACRAGCVPLPQQLVGRHKAECSPRRAPACGVRAEEGAARVHPGRGQEWHAWQAGVAAAFPWGREHRAARHPGRGHHHGRVVLGCRCHGHGGPGGPAGICDGRSHGHRRGQKLRPPRRKACHWYAAQQTRPGLAQVRHLRREAKASNRRWMLRSFQPPLLGVGGWERWQAFIKSAH
mmetsp:Transcript_15484/g.36794  ORF Transcript_15484/g.36794 Transcript_15484/m.36794 type:complete len:282 (-) Transcript_15484:1135-1980(-)